jgi:hypothetical protein
MSHHSPKIMRECEDYFAEWGDEVHHRHHTLPLPPDPHLT